MKELAYVCSNLHTASSLLHIIKFKLSFILYENKADTYNREKRWCDSTENGD